MIPLAEFRNDRIICKHFNLSYVDLRDDISLGDYYCLLAEAYDAEELEDFEGHQEAVSVALAYHQPKKLGRWKWHSIDKAGTQPVGNRKEEIGKSIADFVAPMLAPDNKDPISGSGEEFERATGRKVIFPDGQGGYIDRHGNKVERTKDMIVMRNQQVH